MDVVIRLIVVITLQSTHISKHYTVHLKYIQYLFVVYLNKAGRSLKMLSESENCSVRPTFCDSMDFTVYVILQARILEWIAFPFSRESSQPRDRTQVSYIAGEFFTSWATRKTQEYWSG